MENKAKLTAVCFSDIHNCFTMLEPPYVVRQTVTLAADVLKKEGIKGDVVLVGGDTQSDYPHWNQSGWLPYEYFLGAREATDKVLSELAEGGKVAYVAGNHDYGQGEESTDGPGKNGSYNSGDYYFTGPMNKTFGELPKEDMLVNVSEHTGEKYLLAYRYNVNGVDIFGMSPDPDMIWYSQGWGMSDEILAWMDKRLDAIDPEGVKPIIVVCHYHVATRANGQVHLCGEYTINAAKIFCKHKNLVYLYGHVHSPAFMCREKTSEMFIHFDKDGEVVPMTLKEESSREVFADESKRSFSTVIMGEFRIDGDPELFENDGGTGYGGFKDKERYFLTTATPKLAQGLILRVFDDRMEFEIRNFGTYPGFETEHKLAPYTVYFN